ncbi:MAG: sodium-independent anion transporter [Verrucomicrobiales bacterium]|nr:sodium-independent anion transporter [Verrucomicrobiales bacterium]|tara:strand:+ start:3500 stop:5152 length:1653 start_codon:yes stop_codon:yes gene_type:complete
MFKNFFKKEDLRGDLFGGITAGIVAIPLALAFGSSSGMGAIYGLYGAFAIGIVAAIFGGTPTQISGPTGPMTVISAIVVAAAVTEFGSTEAGLGLIVACFLASGAIQVLMGVLGMGKFIRFIPYPVLSGFMTGIGVIIIILQIFPAFGMASSPKTLEVIKNLGGLFKDPLNFAELGICAATVVIIYTFPRLTKAVPSALVALVAMTATAAIFDLDVRLIADEKGGVPKGFPKILVGELSSVTSAHIVMVIKFGAMLAALGAIDSLLTSVVADKVTRTRHNSNRELIGQGLGNLASGCIGGLPGAGATMRTVVNVNAGGRNKISGVVHGVLLLLLLLGLGPLANKIPFSVLAGILFTVGYGIVDRKGFKDMKAVPVSDSVILWTVLVLTVFWNLLYAVAIGVLMAFLISIKKNGFGGTMSLIGTAERAAKEDGKAESGDVFVHDVKGPQFFGTVFAFRDLVSKFPKAKYVVLNLTEATEFDQSAAYGLGDALLDIKDGDMTPLLITPDNDNKKRLEQTNLIPGTVPSDQVFADSKACNEWLESKGVDAPKA